MLDLSTVLKFSANAAAAASLVNWVAGDIAEEIRRDARTLVGRTRDLARRSPYGAAGAATAIGILAGMLLAKRHHRRT
ncbi:MAG TPA: hypothetical protein VK794_17500 [Steroidobacteraceae bacterium]|jgi:ElaB/YqjD/DUF883 family membrane-anchored ribosome-binding protein|nr:hypothetical protein [Steroidobacteraceae bacterium]